MTNRRVALIGIPAVAVLSTVFAAAPVSAQTKGKAPAAQAYKVPRLADGHPDFQGVWDYRTITPLEVPDGVGGKTEYSDEEAAAVEDQAKNRNQDRRDGAGTDADVARAYNDFWWDFGKKLTTKRTALIVDPKDGKLPAMTEEGKKRIASGISMARNVGINSAPGGGGAARKSDSWLERNTWERCLTYGEIPRMSGAYNNNFSIFQGSDAVVIQYEMIHEARIIPMDGRPHSSVQQYLGEGRGHWEGDTLVVETTNFRPDLAFRGASEKMKLVERFTRTGPDTMMYEFTVTDPSTWTRPFTAQMPISKNAEDVYEYACHEGNHGMFGILSGARAQERAAAEASKKGSN